MKKYYILLLLSITGCIKNESEKLLSPYIQDVFVQVDRYCSNKVNLPEQMSIQLVDSMPNTMVGSCTRYPKVAVIQVNKPAFLTMDDNLRFELIAHEVTHCLLYQDHILKRNHYMAPSLQLITREQVIKQMEKLCK